jgi:hypothetical protein
VKAGHSIRAEPNYNSCHYSPPAGARLLLEQNDVHALNFRRCNCHSRLRS